MTQDQLKKAVSQAALDYIPAGCILGVGTGSTINYFIDALQTVKGKIEAAVASSTATKERLKKLGIPVYELNTVGSLSLYIDSADECNQQGYLNKGGGGALTGEKILAVSAEKFICIVDETKEVSLLGKFPLAIEVIPMARGYVAREIVKLGGNPVLRSGFVTDYGNIILDIHNLDIINPVLLEEKINNIAGVVCNGLFAKRCADEILVGTQTGIKTIKII